MSNYEKNDGKFIGTALSIIVIVGLSFWAYGMFRIYQNDSQRFNVEGTIESVEFIQGGFAVSPKTIVHFTDGTVVPLRGHHSVVVGRKIVITRDRHYKVFSIKEAGR